MISKIMIRNVATYDNVGVAVENLGKVNFIYGANGCGKTTISNFLNNTEGEQFSDCKIEWENDVVEKVYVYNKAFREKNFRESEIAGIFTLGQATSDDIDEINQKKLELDNITKNLVAVSKTQKDLNDKIEKEKLEFKNIIWKDVYKTNEDKFKKAFEGALKKDLFVLKLKEIVLSENDNPDRKDIEERAIELLGNPPIKKEIVSQGNIAMSLVPIIRGRSLMLVGDPQQLSPVILLNPIDNEKLKRIYGVTDEYDYIKNSIYKTYLACDAVSEEILLSHHYRCNKKIISFNNKKYYNNKLIINSPDKEANPLIFKNIPANTTNYKNTAPQEVEEIISFIKEHPDKSIGIITPFTNQKELINKALKDNGMENIPCGTVHAFQGDEKDVVLFSLAITQQTYQGTYDWLKNNKELINVATSRAKDQLVILSDIKELKRLHSAGDDDIYELVDYVQTNGEAQVTARETSSRALGIKPYSTQTEAAFLTTLNHALDNVLNTNNRCVVQREVSIAHVFQENESYDDLFYTGRFDFVVYEKGYRGQDMPILAIELDGKEHNENAIVRARDEKKNAICRAHGFELLRVENSYARRYNYIKNILIQYFKSVR